MITHSLHKEGRTHFTLLLTWLWKILWVIWIRGKVAQQWRCSEGVCIPKEEESQQINQFRGISLLSGERKIFFSVLTGRLLNFLSKNNYRHVGAEGGIGWCAWVYRTHWSPGSSREQRKPRSPVCRPSQCIRLHPPPAGRDHHDQAPCATPCCRPDPGLLWSVQDESLSRRSNFWAAQAGLGDKHRLHHLGNLVFPCNEHAGGVG